MPSPNRTSSVNAPPTVIQFKKFLLSDLATNDGHPLFQSTMEIAREIVDTATSNADTVYSDADVYDRTIKSRAEQVRQFLHGKRPLPTGLREQLIKAVEKRISDLIPEPERDRMLELFHRKLEISEQSRRTRYETVHGGSEQPRSIPSGLVFVTVPYIRIALTNTRSREYFAYFATLLRLNDQVIPDTPLPSEGDPKLPRFVFCMSELKDFLAFWETIVTAALYSKQGEPLALGGRTGLELRANRVLNRLYQLEAAGHLTFWRLPWEVCLTAVTLYGADAESPSGSKCLAMLYPEAFQHYPIPEPFLTGWWRLCREVTSGRLPGSEQVHLSDNTEQIMESVRERLNPD